MILAHEAEFETAGLNSLQQTRKLFSLLLLLVTITYFSTSAVLVTDETSKELLNNTNTVDTVVNTSTQTNADYYISVNIDILVSA